MMIKKITIAIIFIALISPYSIYSVSAESNPGEIYEGSAEIIYRNVTVYAPAVASTDDGYVGVISTITVTIQSNGSGRVFVDTLPLTQVDMQGSARLAVKVASTLVENDINCDTDPSVFDYFFVVRTEAPVIGGPSAGAIMTVATISLLENWKMSNETVMTGMINPDGSIGPIGGIPQKIDAAYSVGATHFLIPYGQGTYIEWETSRDPTTGWITTNPVTKNVADYARDNYNMAVTEVADVTEAVRIFTGFIFDFNTTNGEITTEDYIESMKPLATSLLDEAKQKYDEAKTNLTSAAIPNDYPYYYKDEIEEDLALSEERLKTSEEAYDNETYYTSTSKSFQSLIYSRFVIYACEYWNSEEDKDTFLKEKLEEVKTWHESAAEDAKNAEIVGYISLQSAGAAQRRASEAKINLDSAEESYNDGISRYLDILDYLYKLAFVVERSNSIGWWINIGSYFNETGEVDIDTLENLALEYIEEAQQSTIYSSIILGEIGTTISEASNYLLYAEELLENARNDLDNGYPASALFQALEAIVRANLAIEVIGVEAEDKIDLARESANSKISRSRQQGIEPVLAVSYYEYAESLANESDFDNALLYYKYSSLIAGALSFTNATIGTASSRYVGIPNINTPMSEDVLTLLLAVSIFAVIAGIGMGLLIGGIALKKDKGETKPSNSTQLVKEYNKPPKSPYFSNEEMPRSIKDYYKRNK